MIWYKIFNIIQKATNSSFMDSRIAFIAKSQTLLYKIQITFDPHPYRLYKFSSYPIIKHTSSHLQA